MEHPALVAAAAYYETNYDLVFSRLFRRSEKEELGDRTNRLCRFCGRRPPEVTFGKEAHAVPEALGNRGLTSAYECDTCNSDFGRSIENDLGEWTKPMRTFARIKGKKGVPTLREKAEGGWRIEYGNEAGFKIRAYEDNPIWEFDKDGKGVTFTLRRGAYTPVAVMKAFVKIGLTLMPESEIGAFLPAIDWVREKDHSKSWVRSLPVLHTFQNGPMPNDVMCLMILRRKPTITDAPYATLILGYGNDVFQVFLPAPEQEKPLNGTTFKVTAFPTPGGPDPELYGRAWPKPVDLTGTSVVRGETTKVRLGIGSMTMTESDGEPSPE